MSWVPGPVDDLVSWVPVPCLVVVVVTVVVVVIEVVVVVVVIAKSALWLLPLFN